MTKRNPIVVFLLAFPTLGIYCLYWLVKTKGELNQRGGSVPTAWILIVPIAGPLFFYWMYYYFGQIRHLGASESAAYTTVLFVSMTLGLAGGGWISDRYPGAQVLASLLLPRRMRAGSVIFLGRDAPISTAHICRRIVARSPGSTISSWRRNSAHAPSGLS